MKKLTAICAALLVISGCTDKPEPTIADASPQTESSSPVVTEPNDPAPPAATTQTTLPDAELEAAIRATAPDYNQQMVGTDGDSGKARYTSAKADLNGDGKDEVFVYLMGPFFCGTGGCNLLVFSMGSDGYNLLANIPTSESLVIQAETQNEGYSDIWRMQSGGGMPAEYVRHQYKGGKYIEVSRTPADTKPTGTVVMEEASDFANGMILEPRKE
jgi:hypothetical protein